MNPPPLLLVLLNYSAHFFIRFNISNVNQQNNIQLAKVRNFCFRAARKLLTKKPKNPRELLAKIYV